MNDHWSVSIGQDHMKYVMVNDQAVEVNGFIGLENEWQGDYDHSLIVLDTDFLKY